MARHYRFISADSHYESPPEHWTHRVAEKYRDRAPRRIKLANGKDGLAMEGRPLVYGGTSLYGGRAPEVFDPTQLDYDHTPGCGPAEQRLREQDQGRHRRRSVVRPRRAQCGRSVTRRRVSAWCKASMIFSPKNTAPSIRDRLIGMAVLPNSGVAEDIAEMERCKRMGLKGAWLSTFPSGKGYPTPEDDRFWAAALDLDMPLVIHTSFPTKVGSRETPLFKYPKEPEGEQRPPTDFIQRFARQAPHHSGSVEISQIIVSGIFDRFPKLRIYWAENNVGWLPYFGEQIDHEYETNRFWAERQMGLPRLKRLPSEYLRENAYWGFFEDRIGMKLRHEIGVDRIMWSTDFPHVVTRWPNSLKVLDSQMTGVPADEKRKMVADNAIKFFHLDHSED